MDNNTRSKIIIFGGTTEGRILTEQLHKTERYDITVCTATKYGGDLLPEPDEFLKVISHRIDKEEMLGLIRKELSGQRGLVVDATHPYAALVSKNIKEVCKHTLTDMIRVLRSESEHSFENLGDIKGFKDVRQAVDYLTTVNGNILSTIGSKELGEFCRLADYRNRVYARILSVDEMIEKAKNLGFTDDNLICAQGPFSYEDNLSHIKSSNAKFLVTKESGSAGGFGEKVSACKSLGVQMIIIERPLEEGENKVEFDKALWWIEKWRSQKRNN